MKERDRRRRAEPPASRTIRSRAREVDQRVKLAVLIGRTHAAGYCQTGRMRRLTRKPRQGPMPMNQPRATGRPIAAAAETGPSPGRRPVIGQSSRPASVWPRRDQEDCRVGEV